MNDLHEIYGERAAALIGDALVSNEAYARLEYLCDRIGPRLSGSKGYDAAAAWAAETMRRDGLANVREEPVLVPGWSRGEESARLVEPVERQLMMTGLGMSVGTPAGGITAEVAVVASWEELDSLGEDGVKGRIVLFAVPYEGYGSVARYRMNGASRAAKLGAVAVLVRSATFCCQGWRTAG